jgi:hypothetical protein
MVKAVVMKLAEACEGMAAEPLIGERMPGECVRCKRVAAERVAAKCVPAKATVTAAVTTAPAAVATSAAMCNGAARPYRCAERNRRRERNLPRPRPHERLSFLSRSELFLRRPLANLRTCDRRRRAMPLTIAQRAFVPSRKKARGHAHKQKSAAAQITNATVPDTDVSFQNRGSCYLLMGPVPGGLIGERAIDRNAPSYFDR